MLKLDTNNKKKLKFDVQISGIDSNLLEGALRLVIEGVEYGFPAKFSSNSIEVEVPPLTTVVKEIKDDTVANARLDVYGNGYYINPWKQDILVKKTIKVEATMHQEVEKSTPGMMETSMPEISCSVVMEEVTDEQVAALPSVSSAAGALQQGAYETPTVKEPVLKKKTGRGEEVETDELRTNAVLQKVKDKLDNMKILEKKKPTSENKKPSPPIQKKPVKESKKPEKKQKVIEPTSESITSKEDIYRYMAQRGMKNDRIQKMLFERAEDMTGDSDNIQGIFETVQKMLNTNQM